MTAEDLAIAILTVIGERYQTKFDVPSGKGYYGVSSDPAEVKEDARRQLLDGTDDFVAICEEALRRLKP